MKRTSRIQTVITPLHRKKLDGLTKRYGTMNEVIERGIELLEELETETDIVETEEEIRELRRKSELFDALSSFSGFVLVRSSTVDDLFEALVDGLSLNDFLRKQLNWVAEDLEIQKTVSRLAQNYSKNFASLVEIIQQVSDTFRSFYVLASSEPEKKIVIHPNCFHKFPELIGAQLQGILEFLGFEIKYRIMNDRILLEWQESSEEVTIEREPEVIDIDSRFGLFKELYGQLEPVLEESKSEKEIFKDMINIASNLETPRWNKGLFTTGNRRYTYIPQEMLVELFDEITIRDSSKMNQLFREFGKKLLEIKFPKKETPKVSSGVESLTQFIKSIFNDYFGWGRLEILNIKEEQAEIAIQNPLFNTNALLGIISGLLGHTGYKAITTKSIEEGYYRCEFLITKSSVKIIIVDDEKRVLNSLVKTLEREEELDYELIPVESGEEAIKIVEEQHIDLVLCDHNMPMMSGTQTLEKIRMLDPNIIRILITGYSEIEIARDAINKAKIHYFIEKPLDAQALRDAVQREILKRWEGT
ncbi:MAG: response regulator [Candidatus Hodarchaeales archaeon]|jgi:CheY-like chemotaxis protein